MGVSKSLWAFQKKTGAPSHAQKWQFKHPITPLEYFSAEILVVSAFYI